VNRRELLKKVGGNLDKAPIRYKKCMVDFLDLLLQAKVSWRQLVFLL